MMMTIFKRSGRAVTTTVDILTDTIDDLASMELPMHKLPNSVGEYPASIGDDINLVLLVRELGARKKIKMVSRRDELLKELNQIDKELLQLNVLLDAANSL
jgi:hypothetical protein